jgi:hypothetical protein
MQDTRYGRTILAESPEIPEIVEAVTGYIARRIVERERALAADEDLLLQRSLRDARSRRRTRWRTFRAFLFGLVLGIAAVVGTLALLVSHLRG